MSHSETRLAELVADMTLEEQVSLLSGQDFWSVNPIPRLGIGRLRVTDGPNGARGGGSLIGGVPSAAFPVGIALGATWDTDLMVEIGAALAAEVKAKNAHVLLGPTMNVHRSVTNGRNFECFAEDPVLTAELAVAYVEGLQAHGVAATPKHFAGNESEIQRTTMSSDIDERSLRELYLPAFEAVVRRARPWAIMTAYNRINGTFASEDPWLLGEVLRGQWGFDGVVMSDWFGSHSTAPTVNAGLDLEMPGPTRDRGPKLVAAVREGQVSADTVAERTRNVLRLAARTGALDDHRPFEERAEDRPEDRALIRRAGARGAVLLTNDGLLPLEGAPKIAVIGPNARVAQIMGGGSSQLNAHRRVSPWEGLVVAVGADRLIFAQGCTNHKFQPVIPGPFRVEWFDNDRLDGAPVAVTQQDAATAFWIENLGEGRVDRHNFSARLTGSFIPAASGRHEAGIYSAGLSRLFIDGILVADAWEGWRPGTTFFENGCDEVTGTVDLTAGQTHEVVIEFASKPDVTLGFSAFAAGIGLPLGDAAIADAVEAARSADVAVLCVGRSAEWDTEGTDLPHITLPGRQDALIAAVARANPRTVVVLQTGGPVEMPWIDDVGAVVQAWYPGQEAGHAIADVLTGAADPGGRLPQTFPRRWADNATHSDDPGIYPGVDGRVRYAEGLFTGYRHHDRSGVAPLFPFGHGLSYTEFVLDGLRVEEGPEDVRVHLGITNTGARAGSTVVQLYVSPAPAPVERPARELKAFGRVDLAPGERHEMVLMLPARAFAWYDVDRQAWVVSPGDYGLHAGFSAGDIVARATVQRPAAEWGV